MPVDFPRKTFSDSYLYNLEQAVHDKEITSFILKATRIDKKSEAFKGIIGDVKRQQNSSILHTILMMNNVILCIADPDLPQTYKVFEARDLKNRVDNTRYVFIDVSNLITLKDGYFICKKIDILITYLFDAMSYLLYRTEPIKLMNNSNLTISATECYVALFTYIIDYLRIIGYSQNKTKISYIVALYFLYHMMGKDLDTYSKNIAAKIAGINVNDIKAYELYYDAEEDFQNINTIINLITNTFKLKGLTTEVFISKWIYLIGPGTQYATELFVPFSIILTNAYCGSYIVNQKQIEKYCGKQMVKYVVSLLKLGVDVFDNRMYMSEAELQELEPKSRETLALKESLFKKGPDMSFKKSDFTSKDYIIKKLKDDIKYYIENSKEEKISKMILDVWKQANAGADRYIYKGEKVYELSTQLEILKIGKKYLNDKDRGNIIHSLELLITQYQNELDEIKDDYKDREFIKRSNIILLETKKALNMIK